MELTQENRNINFFKPVGAFMKKDVGVKKIILLVWFFGNFGMLFALRLLADPTDVVQVTRNTGEVVQQLTGKSFLTETAFLGFPFHYWYSAQFVIFMFIGLCYLYCKFIDRLEEKHF